MHGVPVDSLDCVGTDGILLQGSFQCNAAANPLVANNRYSPGCNFTVAYTATGIYTVTLDPTLTLPALPEEISVKPQAATLATDWFECLVIGEFTLATRSFVIQAHRNGIAQAPAATAGNRINWAIKFRNSTSR